MGLKLSLHCTEWLYIHYADHYHKYIQVHPSPPKATSQNKTRKLNETLSQTDTQQIYGSFDIHIRFISGTGQNGDNLTCRLELNGH